ncbi:MAG: hypothetical protein ABFD79_06810 [Phycisphaerales bacterium]
MDENEKLVIQNITGKVRPLIERREYKKAVEILKSGFQQYPNQKELAALYSEIKTKYKNEKIHKLQEQAVVFLQSGAEDKAQETLREIFKLDPTRVELKDAFRKTRKEVVTEYNNRVIKTELISSFIKVALAGVAIFLVIAVILWFGNNKHIKLSMQYLKNGDLYNAKQEVKKCGKYFSGGKTKVYLQIQSEVNKLIDNAHKAIDKKDFTAAKKYYDDAINASEDDFKIRAELNKCHEQEQLWKQELARLEKEKVLKDKILAEKTEYQKVLDETTNAAGNENEVIKILESAKARAQDAENLFNENKFEESEKYWAGSLQECEKAFKLAEKIVNRRNEITKDTLGLKQVCDEIIIKGKNINAHLLAKDTWTQGQLIADQAQRNFDEKKMDDASKYWKEAAEKFNSALEITKKDPNYTRAMAYVKKWNLIKPGLPEESIRNFLGMPRYVQTDSDKSIWYYQTIPTITKNENSYELGNPTCGYIIFTTVSVEAIINSFNEIYIKKLAEENEAYKKTIRDIGLKSRNRNLNSSQRQNLNDTKAKEDKKHIDKIDKLKKENEELIFDLKNGISPREPEYVTTEWAGPDPEQLACFMNLNADEEKTIKPAMKWQIPVRWRSLKLNIGVEDVFTALGEPDEKINDDGKLIYHYGQSGEEGIVVFENCPDSINRLRYWKEPLWPIVKQEISNWQTQTAAEENEKTKVETQDPNGEKI